jgi:hypothetical protein
VSVECYVCSLFAVKQTRLAHGVSIYESVSVSKLYVSVDNTVVLTIAIVSLKYTVPVEYSA